MPVMITVLWGGLLWPSEFAYQHEFPGLIVMNSYEEWTRSRVGWVLPSHGRPMSPISDCRCMESLASKGLPQQCVDESGGLWSFDFLRQTYYTDVIAPGSIFQILYFSFQCFVIAGKSCNFEVKSLKSRLRIIEWDFHMLNGFMMLVNDLTVSRKLSREFGKDAFFQVSSLSISGSVNGVWVMLASESAGTASLAASSWITLVMCWSASWVCFLVAFFMFWIK